MEDPINSMKGSGPLGKSSILRNIRNFVSATKVKNLRKGEKHYDYDLHLIGRSHVIDSFETRHE